MDYQDAYSTPAIVFLMIYMVMAFCCTCFILASGIVVLVLASMGKYSWYSLAVWLIAVSIGCLCYAFDRIGGVVWCVALSPLVGATMLWCERQRIKKLR